MIRVCLPAAVICLLAVPASAETLKEAIALAYETNPLLAEAVARQDALEESITQARSEGRPTSYVNMVTEYDSPGDGSISNAQIGADLPIWTGGRVKSAVKASQLDVAAGVQRLHDVEAEVLERVVVAYADVLFAQQAFDVARIGIERLDRQVAEAQLRFNLGEVTLTDVAQLRAQRANVLSNLADAEAALVTAVSAYRANVGRAPGDLDTQIPTPTLPGDLPSVRDAAISVSPLVLEQKRIVEASAARIDRARASRRPTIGLAGSYGQGIRWSDDAIRDFDSAATVRVTFRLPILSGGLLESRVREADATYRAETYALASVEREAIRKAEVAWARLQTTRAQMVASAEALKSAELALNGVQAEYEFGLRSTIDLLLSEQSYRNAQLARARSHSDFIIEQARLLRAIGSLDYNTYL